MDGLGQVEFGSRGGRIDDGQSGSQSPVVEACIEDCDAQALGGDSISMGLGNAGDQALEAQASQVVGDPSRGQLSGVEAEQRREMLAHVLVREGALGEKKQEQDLEQSLDAGGLRSAGPGFAGRRQ